jgi:hypothetical protein
MREDGRRAHSPGTRLHRVWWPPAPPTAFRLRAASGRAPPEVVPVDQEFGEGAAPWLAPELSDPVGSLEVGEDQDVEQPGAWSGAERVQTGLESPFDFIWTHG